MLTLSIDHKDLPGPWQLRDGNLECAGSWIRPLTHPALETVTAGDGARILLSVRERAAGRTSGPVEAVPDTDARSWNRLADDCGNWPLEHLTVRIDRRHRTVTATAGTWGTLPLYLATDAGRLRASWRLADLRPCLKADDLDATEVAGLLTCRHRYARTTPFRGVERLTERSTAAFGAAGLRLAYPEPARHSLPRELSTGADPVRVLDALLAEAVARRPLGTAPLSVQLSGGIDSANVALTLSALTPGRTRPGAMLLGGAAGEQQAERRRLMIERMGMEGDVTVRASARPPFGPGSIRLAEPLWASPLEEPYLEMADALATALAVHGPGVVYTGFGGDEFSSVPRTGAPPGNRAEWMPPRWCGPRVREVEELRREGVAPSTAAHRSTLLAMGTVGPLLVRRGLWPVAPFADPWVVRVGEWLPERWRRGKRLLRQRLADAGMPPVVVHPPLAENFRQVMASAVHRHLAPLLLRWSGDMLLAEAGFIDPAALAETADAAARDPGTAAGHPQLYAVAALENYLRAL